MTSTLENYIPIIKRLINWTKGGHPRSPKYRTYRKLVKEYLNRIEITFVDHRGKWIHYIGVLKNKKIQYPKKGVIFQKLFIYLKDEHHIDWNIMEIKI